MQELVDRYLARHEQIRSPRTIATLRERLTRPLHAYGEVRLAELEGMSHVLAEWRMTLPPRYAHKVMSAFRQVLAGGVRWRLLATNPAADAGPNPEPPLAPIRPYTRAELDAIEAELDPRYAPIVPLGAATGSGPRSGRPSSADTSIAPVGSSRSSRGTSARRSSPAPRRPTRFAKCH